MQFLSVRQTRLVVASVFLAIAVAIGAFAPSPARADGAASTRNIVLGVAAAIAADVIYNNIHHKQVQHDTVVGRTNDGGIIYGDGRVAYPSGDVLYTGANGQPCRYDGHGRSCGYGAPVVYYPRGYDGHDHGNHYGQYDHRDRHRNRHRDGDDRGHRDREHHDRDD